MSWSSGEQWLDPSTTSRSGPALVPLEPLSGEQGSIPLAAPEAETSSQVSGRETLEKPDNTSILAPLATLGKPSGPKCLLACNKLLQALPGRILCTHCGWPPRPLPWCRNLSGLTALCPTSRPGLQSSTRDALTYAAPVIDGTRPKAPIVSMPKGAFIPARVRPVGPARPALADLG